MGHVWDCCGCAGAYELIAVLNTLIKRPTIQPFTWSFPRADIHELLSPDILHQLVKGTFKDHLVTWIEQYISGTSTAAEAKRIMDDIDRRCVCVIALLRAVSIKTHDSWIESLRRQHFLASVGFLKVATSNNGPEMIPRL